MAQVVIDATYVAGTWLRNANYFTCRDADDGNVGQPKVGQTYDGAFGYEVSRAFIYFDISTLPANAMITAAKITDNISTNQAYYSFNMIMREAPSASNPLIAGDYALTHYSGDDLAKEQISFGDGGVTFTLNNAGINYLNAHKGINQFVFLSDEDINNSPPVGYEWVNLGGVPATIHLTLTYFEPTEAPIVETIDEACEDRQSTTLTAVGEITGTGDGYTYRGFEYYQYTEEGEYDSSMWAVREIGRFHTLGEFRMTLYGLKPLTCYWIRAYAGNVFGISYGDWVLCCTTAVPTAASYGIHEEDNSGPDSDGTYAGGNTISFYVRKVGGKWSKKYGPYHSDQVDIAVADVMIEGTGKYQVKFESGALTGISTQVMCKLDIKAR